MKLFLIGMPGSGKSTTAKAIAKFKKISFFDTDELIQKKYQLSVSEIFNSLGENVFRKYENKILEEIILTENNFVVATGGGLPCFNGNMGKMNKAGITVYLKVSIDKIIQRINFSGTRPLLSGKSKEELFNYLTETLKNRELFYHRAKYIIDAEKDINDILLSEPFNL